MCTSLLYCDLSGSVYAGRTMELPVELPYLATFLPRGTPFSSKVGTHAEITFESQYAILGFAVPNGSVKDLKIVEAMNEAGLDFSLLAFADTHGPDDTLPPETAVLSAIDLGAWILGQFATVAEVKAALEAQPVLIEPMAALGGTIPPFHYTVHDRSGASIVIEFFDGERHIFDNPIGVMTNSPRFDWHLTNLNNYTFFSNIDQTSATILGHEFVQPDSGIATAGLPASDTAVGRFVRAAYYANFTEKADGPDAAILELSHVMNKFDRPRGASRYASAKASALTSSAAQIMGKADEKKTDTITEYTSWTSLTDLERKKIFVKPYSSLGYVSLDLDKLAEAGAPRIVPLERFSQTEGSATDVMLAH
ncbi:linear amide C-N hydrolase [Martelella alba]|uniref:Linear amide C-N hydrolase n=1 Tax=Martelella alba TaxID=2590451 RepID=A0A506UJ79_9HYPH|nr:linear amide C-N hydrolase [Martelella alba]TPW33358.1 linear amide C-N hydrolase [Martelella alba]